MPGKHHLRGFKIAKKIGSPLRGSWTMVSIALVDARKTSLTGVQNSKKIGSPLRGSWTMVSIALVDARKTSLMGVQNSTKIGSPLRGSEHRRWVKPPPLRKKARSAPDVHEMGKLSPSSPCLICDFSTFCNVYSLREMFVYRYIIFTVDIFSVKYNEQIVLLIF